jgi:hypothetical protein
MPAVTLTSKAQSLFDPGYGPVLIVNDSESATMWIGPQPAVSANDTPIAPQASVTLDGTVRWYGSTLTGSGTVEALILPGGTDWQNPVGVSVALNTLGLAKDVSVTTLLPNTLQTGGIPPYLPNPATYASGNVAPGSTVTLVSWSSGMKRLWDTYVSVCASSNTNYGTLQTGYFLASIIDADDNIYASTLVRITGPDQTVSNAIPFDGKGFELAGPNSLSVMVTDAINDVNCSASGGVMIST